MKKILCFSHCLNTGGGQLRLKDLVSGLKDFGHDCQVWAPYEGELLSDYKSQNIPVFINDFEVDKVNRKSKLYFDKNLKKKINKIIQKYSKSNKKIAIRCAGSLTIKLLNEFDLSKLNIVGIFDNDFSLFNTSIKGIKIYPKERIQEFKPDVIIISHLQPKFIKKNLEYKKAKIIEPFKSGGLDNFKKLLSFAMNMIYPVKFFEKLDPDIVLINNARNFWAVLAAKILRKKVIWIIRESFDPFSSRYFPHFIYLLSFQLANKIVFPSYSTCKLYERLIPKDRIEIIHDGLHFKEMDAFKNAEKADTTKKELQIPQNHKIISIIGTVEPRKGQVYFAKAAINFLKSSKEKNNTFLIIGTANDKYSQEIKNLIEKSGFKDKFRILPVIRPAYKFFNITDIFVCCSSIEAFPNVILEAMAFNCAIISTDVYGIPEAVSNNKEAILLPVSDLEKNLQKSLEELFCSPESMNAISESAHKKFMEKFTFNKMILKYKNLVDSL